MDAAVEYRVVFGGHVRNGFEADTVREALARQLKLSAGQSERLFREGKHTLKRTASEEEARRYVMLLAKLGAVASVEPTASGSNGVDAPEPETKPKKADAPHPLPKYSPLPRNALLKPLLYLSVAVEALFALLYIALLAIVAAGTFYYSIFTLWASALVGNPLLALAVQIIGFALGLVLLVLLAKPLLSLHRRPHRGILLSPQQEQDMHLFVEDLCQRLELPAPQEIRINNDIDVCMHHYRGPLGFWRGQLVLSIGAPLLATMNTSQLAALIARAMLSFRSPLSPRLCFLLMASAQWQHQAVFGEDVIDRGLQRWGDEGRLSPGVVRALQALLGYSRRVMQLRLVLSRWLERRLVHRLIAEADKKAFALAGNEGFSHLLEQQRLLQHATTEAIPDLQQQWRENGELPVDMIHLILQQARRYPASIHEQLRRQQEREKARTGDIIPSDGQRIKSLSRQQRLPGYDCLSPANSLLRYFSKLAHTMTLRFYHNRMNIPVTPDKLIRPVIPGSAEDKANRLIDDYFSQIWYPLLPLKLGLQLQGLEDEQAAREQWQKARDKIEHERSHARHEYGECIEAEEQLLDDSLRETLYQAEMWRQLGESKPGKEELEAFLQRCRDSEDRYEESLQKVRQYLKPHAQRLAAALALLQARAEDDKAVREMRVLVGIYDRIEAVLPQLRSLKLHTAQLQVLLSYRSGSKQVKLHDRIEEQASDIRQQLTSIRVALKDVINPYPAPRGGKRLMNYLLLEAYSEQGPTGDFDRGHDVLLRLSALQRRILARLISLAREAEPGTD